MEDVITTSLAQYLLVVYGAKAEQEADARMWAAIAGDDVKEAAKWLGITQLIHDMQYVANGGSVH